MRRMVTSGENGDHGLPQIPGGEAPCFSALSCAARSRAWVASAWRSLSEAFFAKFSQSSTVFNSGVPSLRSLVLSLRRAYSAPAQGSGLTGGTGGCALRAADRRATNRTRD